MIAVLDAGPLFASDAGSRASVDQALWAAAREAGFVCGHGFPTDVPLGPTARARLLEDHFVR